ncbi:hypothetical protein LCGC14_0770840 [marine sediment metagenome]|uniref:Uncharacterized protein n=1 Tax=marine sediment metagenome TaxID=412755 RepID=A0A0F9SIC0_9ZZZZ
MKKELVSLKEFAELTGHEPSYISQLIKEPQIEIVKIGIHKFIDINKFPPKNFTKKDKK